MKWKTLNPYTVETDCGQCRITVSYYKTEPTYTVWQNQGGDEWKATRYTKNKPEALQHAAMIVT